MMRQLFMPVLALVVPLSTGAVARPAATAPSLLGTWSLDVARLPIPPEARPRSVTISFADAGAEKWRTTVVITGGDGSERRMVSSYQRDGRAVAVEGDQDEGDKVAVSTPTPTIMVLSLSRLGRPGSTRVYSVAPDGRTMTETAVTYDDTGAPQMRTNLFARVGK